MARPFPVYTVTLTAAFVVLDVAGEIDWPWWLIVMPVLISIVIGMLIWLASLAER